MKLTSSEYKRTLTIIIRVMTGFIWYCINYTRNNNFTNHDMSYCETILHDDIAFFLFLCNLLLQQLFTTAIAFSVPHILEFELQYIY